MRYCSIFSTKHPNHNNIKFPFIFLYVLLVTTSCCYKPSVVNNYHLNVVPEIRRPGFWISQLSAPDSVIMNSEQIKAFNSNIANKKLVMQMDRDIIMKIKKEALKKDMLSMYGYVSKKKLYNENGNLLQNAYYKKIYENMNINNINNNKSFAFIIKFSNQHLIPSDERLFDNPNYQYFDRNQNNGLDIGEPVVIVHTSYDNKWKFVMSKYSSGWVRSDNVVKIDYSDIALIDKVNFIVITEYKADLYEDPLLKNYFATTRMGNRYILTGSYNDYYELLIPQINIKNYLYYKKVYIDKRDAHVGYLPFTQRNALLQAFKLLNTPYGWGDMAQEQDCSKFLQEVFLTFGITLPRNSSGQAKSGYNIYLRDKKKGILRDIVQKDLKAGVTTIQMPGHIMLYIGEYKDEHYVIHDLFGATIKRNNKLYNLIINKVEVTPLSLGKETKSGSFIDRIRSINLIKEASFE